MNFKILLEYVEPNNMIKQALKRNMTQEGEADKYYLTQYHTVAKSHNMDTTHWQGNVIFMASLPYRLFFLIVHQANFNRNAKNNALRLCWEKIFNFQVSINRKKVGRTIDSSQQAYIALPRTLH